MKNEVLAKVLCHNLVVLVHEMDKLGIDVGFTEQRAEPTVLKFPAV